MSDLSRLSPGDVLIGFSKRGLVSVVSNPDTRVTTTWRTTRPIPTYGMIIAAAPLARASR